jgi:hypothetical protein
MRVVAISDQHGHLPDIPECDLLICAGDQCPDYPKTAAHRIGSGPQVQAQAEWFINVWLPWREKQPVPTCVLTWGNHCYCGQLFHAPLGGNSHVSFGEKSRTTMCVVDGLVEVDGLKIWLTPWSSQFRDWAFMADDDQLAEKYAAIPAGIDILVSHQPPYQICDGVAVTLLPRNPGERIVREHLGSKALRSALHRVNPRVLICGHIHGGHGHVNWPRITHKRFDDEFEDCGTVTSRCDVYNVALLDEAYKVRWAPTIIDISKNGDANETVVQDLSPVR